jgi:hypothetical protein
MVRAKIIAFTRSGGTANYSGSGGGGTVFEITPLYIASRVIISAMNPACAHSQRQNSAMSPCPYFLASPDLQSLKSVT